MIYRLIQNIDGEFIKTEFGPQPCDVIEAMAVRGFAFTRMNSNPAQRDELQGQPKFAGLAGPMWDGDAVRYEDAKSNDILST